MVRNVRSSKICLRIGARCSTWPKSKCADFTYNPNYLPCDHLCNRVFFTARNARARLNMRNHTIILTYLKTQLATIRSKLACSRRLGGEKAGRGFQGNGLVNKVGYFLMGKGIAWVAGVVYYGRGG
jgi:hypothetical protein